MQRVLFLRVGRIKTSWISAGSEHFASRLAPHVRVEVIEIPASNHIDPQKYRSEESERILAKLDRLEGDVWLLDEEGVEMTSVEFSKFLERAKDAGATLVFVLGGAYGVTKAVKERATQILALSRMTFPHEFCSLVFIEQLYRASEISRNTGYHH